MGKRLTAAAFTMMLAASALFAVPARAADPVTAVPDTVQINDPVGDANYVNDQSLLSGVPEENDQTTPKDAGSVSDLLKIWYTSDASTVSVHIQTELPPPATASYIFRVYSNPGEGSVASSTLGCLRFFAFIPGDGGGYAGDEYAGLLDLCNVGTDYAKNAVEAPLQVDTLADGTGVMTITVPRSYSPLLGPGMTLEKPFASVRNLVGTGPDGDGQASTPDPNARWKGTAQIDNSKIGTDYALQDEGPAGGDTCSKAKGKAKGHHKKPKPCPPPAAAPSPSPSESEAP
ncbi:MAG: hypothetical protein M3290_04465 [Actinomycetota bacterium]|nr:hypothetical protein [Actinomycetota bacterium]